MMKELFTPKEVSTIHWRIKGVHFVVYFRKTDEGVSIIRISALDSSYDLTEVLDESILKELVNEANSQTS